MIPGRLHPGRLHASDLARLASAGLRAKPLRAALSAMGIAIGVAAMFAVVGISASSRADLDRMLSALGTNLLTAAPGSTLFGEDAKLPVDAVRMVSRIGPVQSVSAIGRVPAAVYRNEFIPPGQTGGLAVYAARLDLPETVGARVAAGDWLSTATERFPAVVLGARAAERLAVHRPGMRVWLGGQWFSLVGVLAPTPLAPELDTAALVGWIAAQDFLAFDGHPTTVYTRSREDAVEQVRRVLAASANPERPHEVKVSRPSDALAAKRAALGTLDALLLGLGAVALLVGGIGVANTMIISVLERRSEIGLRRSLGATRGHIRVQFLAESLLLSAFGGAGGVVLGAAVTAGYAWSREWPAVLPLPAVAAGFCAAVAIGAVAGVYPALRAARMSPTEALARD